MTEEVEEWQAVASVAQAGPREPWPCCLRSHRPGSPNASCQVASVAPTEPPPSMESAGCAPKVCCDLGDVERALGRGRMNAIDEAQVFPATGRTARWTVIGELIRWA
jgi:hypothetical protein